jgi:hypothetical protein
LRIAQARAVSNGELQSLLEWISSSATNNDEVVREHLQRWVPEYTPTPNGH